MDGDLKPLAKIIANLNIKGIESFTPYPDSDMSISEAVSIWPDKRLLLNFPSSVHLSGPKAVYQKTEEILEEAGHSGYLQIQISERAPSKAWQKTFPEIVKAIKKFGAPKS